MNATESKIDTQEMRQPHAVMSAHVMETPEAPGIQFVWPTHAPRHGYPQNKRGFSIPFVLVTQLATGEELIAAAEHVGRGFGMTVTLRRAVKTWLRSDEAQKWPARQEGESRDDAVRRVRQMSAEHDRRRSEQAELDAQRKEGERLAQMTDEQRAWKQARDEVIDRHVAQMSAELDALKAAHPELKG